MTRLAILALVTWFIAVAVSCSMPRRGVWSETHPGDNDYLHQDLGPSLTTPTGNVQLRARLYASTLSWDVGTMLVRTADGSVLAAGPAYDFAFVRGDCNARSGCRAHVFRWWSRPKASHAVPEPAASYGPPLNIRDDWRIIPALPQVSRPLLHLPLYWDTAVIRMASISLWAFWLGGVTVIVGLRLGSWFLEGLGALIAVAVTPAFFLYGLTRGLIIDVALLWTLLLLVSVWVLSRRLAPRLRSASKPVPLLNFGV